MTKFTGQPGISPTPPPQTSQAFGLAVSTRIMSFWNEWLIEKMNYGPEHSASNKVETKGSMPGTYHLLEDWTTSHDSSRELSNRLNITWYRFEWENLDHEMLHPLYQILGLHKTSAVWRQLVERVILCWKWEYSFWSWDPCRSQLCFHIWIR